MRVFDSSRVGHSRLECPKGGPVGGSEERLCEESTMLGVCCLRVESSARERQGAMQQGGVSGVGGVSGGRERCNDEARVVLCFLPNKVRASSEVKLARREDQSGTVSPKMLMLAMPQAASVVLAGLFIGEHEGGGEEICGAVKTDD